MKSDNQQPNEVFIGQAWLEHDLTIVLRLRAKQDGMIGEGTLRYPKSHPQYAEIMNHLEGLIEGEIKPVRPFDN